MLPSNNAAPDRARTTAEENLREEAILFHRASRGDLRAFEELYRAYHPRLTRFLLNITRRPPLADEVLNDTMMVLWNRPDSYNGRSKLSTWIFAIAYRKALKAMKRQDVPMEDHQAEFRRSDQPDPEDDLGRRQSQQIVLHALGELSPDHRAVVDLSYFHEMGYREIAEIMACPTDTIKTRMFHARRHLKNRLGGSMTDWL